jgi:hypothetical protein
MIFLPISRKIDYVIDLGEDTQTDGHADNGDLINLISPFKENRLTRRLK